MTMTFIRINSEAISHFKETDVICRHPLGSTLMASMTSRWTISLFELVSPEGTPIKRAMSGPRICDDKDLIELCPQLDLWLKPHAKINITVTLPSIKTMDNSGQMLTISTWEVMDKIKKKVKPLKFKTLKVSKSNIEFIRFEAECESQSQLALIESRLNKISLKLSGFAESLTVRSARVKIGISSLSCVSLCHWWLASQGSTRHEWESYFRDNPNMNEMKPGLRPDTIRLEVRPDAIDLHHWNQWKNVFQCQSLPVRWFGGEKPSPNLLVKVFGTFGEIRRFHIPCLDLKEEEDGFKRFNFKESLSFDAYIQYKDYIGFVKAMDALRGMKLVKKLSEVKNQKNFLEYDIKLDFDKTKHLSDKAIKKRLIARDYGIKSAVELKKLRDEAKKQRELYRSRVEFLRKRKQTARNFLRYLFSLVEPKVKARKQLEEQKSAEQKIKERLLLEEVKLREKLLEKRREMLREQAKGKVKSVATTASASGTTCPSNDLHLNSDQSFSNTQHKSSLNTNISSFNSYPFHSRKYPNHYMNNNYLNYRRFLYLNHQRRPLHQPIQPPIDKSLYKHHKKSCKHYRPKSIVVQTSNSDRNRF